MKLTSVLLLLITLISCKQRTKNDGPSKSIIQKNIQDTIIVKNKNKLDKSYEVGFYSKSYSYFWLVGKDTLDFSINATEYENDSTLHLNIHHNNPILFTTVLNRIDKCIPIIQENFMIPKLSSFYFKEPIYYKDIANELSNEYFRKFGKNNIDYQKLNEFLLESNLNSKLDNFLVQMNKNVQYYSIEKFHFLKKEYFNSYIPNENLTNYPEFTIHGMELYVRIVDKK